MKQEIKVGDWVKISYWKDFFEVIDVTEDEITLQNDNGQYSSNYCKNDNWIIKEKGQKMKIEMNKKYRRVGTHEPVRVICVDMKTEGMKDWCVGLLTCKYDSDEFTITFSQEGKSLSGNQIVEEVPATDWSKVKVDAPIFVKYAGTILKRHFSNFDGKRVYFYPDGTTSFTCDGSFSILSVYMDDCWLEKP